MPNNNDDIINDILNELDHKKNDTASSPSVNDTDDNKTMVTPVLPHKPVVSHVSNDAPTSMFKADNEAPEISSENVSHHAKPPKKSRPEPSHDEPELKHSDVPKNKKKKKKKSRLPGVLILTTFIFAVSICLSLVIIAFGKDMLGIGKSDTTHMIVIDDGATTEDVINILEKNGIIKSPECFKLFAKFSNPKGNYIAGEHFVRPNMAYETLLKELTSVEYEKKQSVEVTFPEGITLYDAAVILEDKGVCTKDDFLLNFNGGNLGFEFEKLLPAPSSLRFYPMEGYLFPDTYYFYQEMDPEQVCQKIYMNFNDKMTDDRIQKMENLGLDLNKLITFASIVQKEAADTDSMKMVASVFWNRIDNPTAFPLLQSDPTKNYSEQVIKPHIEVYDQAIIDAYNTYVTKGLPPGPICNPGIEAIDAVLQDYASDYYYFIADLKSGRTYFSENLEDHEFKKEAIEANYEAEENGEETKDIDALIREYENGGSDNEEDDENSDDQSYDEEYSDDNSDDNDYSDDQNYDDEGYEFY